MSGLNFARVADFDLHHMQFHTVTKLSPRQELTPEGYLLCRDVAIARTGQQLYAAGEVPVTAVNGLITIDREADEVFSPRTIRSFEGKPVCLDHPTEDVSPKNWAQLAKGVLQNVRPGTGIDSDVLLSDLLITDAAAIARVREGGLREVSCGYDADYEELEPGHGKQTNIIGNHLALVDRGRCGARCAIGDGEKEKPMKKLKLLDGLRAAFKARDEAAHEKVLAQATLDADEEETEEEKKKRLAKEESEKTSDALGKVLDALKTIDGRLSALETRDASSRSKDGEDDETEEEKKKRMAKEKEKESTDDSGALPLEMQDVIARVEILSPGMTVSVPTFDAKAKNAAAVRDSLCALRRKALEAAYASPKTRDAVAPLVAGKDLATMTCDALSAAFIGASEIVRRENNAAVNATFDGGKAANGVANQITAMNAKNAAFWARN